MSLMEINCPACQKRLRLSATLQGKTIRCPACQAAIALRPAVTDAPRTAPAAPPAAPPAATSAPSPQAKRITAPASPPARPSRPRTRRPTRRTSAASVGAIDEIESYDELEPDEFTEDYDDPYAAGSIAARNRRPKPKVPLRTRLKRFVPLLLSLAGIGFVAIVAVIAFTIMPAVRIPGLSGNVVDLRYCPESTIGFVHADVADILASNVMKGILDHKPEIRAILAGPTDSMGLTAEDIRSITIAFCRPAARPSAAAAMAEVPGWMGTSTTSEMTVVVRLKESRPSDRLKLKKFETHNGADLYEAAGRTLWMPDQSTMVIASRDAILAAVDRGEQEHRFSQFDFASGSYDLIVAGDNAAANVNSSSSPASSPVIGLNPFSGLTGPTPQVPKATAFAASFTGRIDLLAQIVCQDSQSAELAIAELQKNISRFQEGNTGSFGAVMPYTVTEALRSILQRLTVSRSGPTVNLSTSIERKDIDRMASITYGNK